MVKTDLSLSDQKNHLTILCNYRNYIDGVRTLNRSINCAPGGRRTCFAHLLLKRYVVSGESKTQHRRISISGLRYLSGIENVSRKITK